jgi:beta-barrel assembly-enhancing protease
MKRTCMILVLCCIFVAGAGAAGPLRAGEMSALGEDVQSLLLQARGEEQVLNNGGLIFEDPELENYLNHIVRDLQPSEFRGDLMFRVKVIKDPHLNAFVFPHGPIYINTGMLARLENEAQAATVLAHEMAHALRGHALKIFRSLKDGAVAQVAIHEGAAQSIGAYFCLLEQEADRLGLELVIKAGYDPLEGIDVFRHLEKESIREEIHEPFVSQTRPSLRDRMRDLRKILRSHGVAHVPGREQRGIFLQKIKGALLENANLDLQIGRFAAAQREALKYLGIVPRDARALYLLGEVSRRRGLDGDTRRARAFYEKAISVDPSYAEPYRSLGLLQYKAGEMMLARKSFQWCLVLSPDRKDRAYIQDYVRKCKQAGTRKGAGS